MGQHKKKILILGGETKDIVEVAQQMGLYVIVTSNQDKGSGKEIADEKLMISTTDFDSLEHYIRQNNVSGVFAGPSEFHLNSVMTICKRVGLPFYATEEQWELCSRKDKFKELCRKHNIPTVPEYEITEAYLQEDLNNIEYPVIVKPVDSSSSKGIKICYNSYELSSAIDYALSFSMAKKVIVEKYIKNEGYITNVRYVACDGKFYLSLLGDVYIVDPFANTALISSVAIYPSKFTKTFLNELNDKVISMFNDIGFQNGSFFLQAIPQNGKLYFHEMGLRLSGGLLYKITEKANNINDVKMMLRYAVGYPICTEVELKQFDPFLKDKLGIDFPIPLKTGIIKKIVGLDKIKAMPEVIDIMQYYETGDTITKKFIGTLQQHFCRIKFFARNINNAIEVIDNIQDTLQILNERDESLIYKKFDTNRL
jgi:biotin carboxylase